MCVCGGGEEGREDSKDEGPVVKCVMGRCRRTGVVVWDGRDHFVGCLNAESLCCTPDTNITLSVNWKLKINNNKLKES